MLKGIIFDWDGVLVDSIRLQHQFMEQLCNKYNKNYPFKSSEHVRQNWREPFFEVYESFGFDWKNDQPHIAQEFRTFMNKSTIPFIPGMPEVIKELAQNNIKLGIASSNLSSIIRTNLEKEDLHHCVSTVITGDDVKVHKPDPTSINHCREKMGLLSSEAIYVGDQPIDVIAARKADMPCIAVSWGWANREKIEQARPDYIVETPQELLSLLDSLLS